MSFSDRCLKKIGVRDRQEALKRLPLYKEPKFSWYIIWAVILLLIVIIGAIVLIVMYLNREVDQVALIGAIVLSILALIAFILI